MGLTRIRADQISDIDYKQAVRVLTLSNVILSGGAPSQVDGVNLNFDDRILVAGQTTTSQNGIYYVATLGSGVNGTWVRASDANATGEIAAGMIVMVTEGNTYADTSWKLITNNPIVIGTTGLVFAQNTGDSFGVINANGTPVVANSVTSTAIFSSGNNLVLTGNASSDTITFAVSDTPTFTTVSASGNVYGGNLSASGNVNATYFIGDGSYLTGIVPVIQSYLFANVASNISPYYQAVPISQFTIGTLATATTTVGTTATLIGEFITNLGYPNATSIPPGQITGRYETTKGNGAKFYTTYFTLVKRNLAGTETVLLTSDITTPTAVNTLVQQVTTALNTSTISLLTTDRLAVKIYAYTASGTDDITLGWDDNTDSGFDLPTPPASVADFVPYQNATANVFLGPYSLSTAGNVTGNYFIGNGSQLTGIVAGTTYANANAVAYGEAGWAGNIIPSANNVFSLGSPTAQWASVYVSANTLYLGNTPISTAGNSLIVNGDTVVTADPTGTASTTGNVAISGNITGNNVLTTGVVSATGNITGSYIIGNGSQLTGLPAGYSNADVATYLSSGTVTTNILTTANISATSNITVGNIATLNNFVISPVVHGSTNYDEIRATTNDVNFLAAAGKQITQASDQYSQLYWTSNIANVDTVNGNDNFVWAYAYNGGFDVAATIGGNTKRLRWAAATGNLIAEGSIEAYGNITGANLSIASILASANISASGTIIGSRLTGNLTTNAQSNITSVGTLTSLTSSGLISTTGNVVGNYIIGNGSLLSNINAANITGAYGNSNVAAYLPTYTGNLTAGNISVTGAISTANITMSGDLIVGTGPTLTIDPNGSGGTDGNVVIAGNLTVTGTTTTINSNTISTNDLTINMANNAANATAANNGGIEVGPVGSPYATLLYNTASNVWVASLGISSLGNISTTRNITSGNLLTGGFVSATGNVTGNYIIGNGSQLTSLTGTNVTGTVANATFATSAGTATSATTAGTVTTNAQSNITSVGTLTSLTASGLISTTGNVVGNYIIGNGSQLTGITVSGSLSWTTQANTAPSGVNPGSFWYDSYSGVKYQYTNDGTSNVWVDQSFPTSFTTLAVTGNATIGGNLAVTGTISYGNISSPGFVSATGNVTGGNINTAGIMSSTGNVQAGNIRTVGLISATGAITGGSATVGTGNITVGNLLISGAIVDSAQLDIQTSAANANIVLTPNGTGNVNTGANVSITGNVQAGNVRTAGSISATGNITGGNISGTLLTVAQPNITSVGTLTSLSITGNLNVDSNTLFVDSANNEVGLGTISPAAQLAIVGAGQNVATMNTSANLGGTIIVSDTGGSVGNGGAIIFSAASQAWNFAAIKGLVTNGGNNTQGDLAFSVRRVVTDATLTEAMRITSQGVVSVSGNITSSNLSVGTGTVTVGNIVNSNANAVGNIGSSSLYFNTVFAKATSALYADLAEMYAADQDYAPGTVVEFGDPQEIRASQTSHSTSVAGIISTNPSYLMNAAQPGDYVLPVALTGRVPCRVVGTIRKGDRLVASDIPGVATVLDISKYEPSCIIGKALENYDSTDVGVIEVAVGRT